MKKPAVFTIAVAAASLTLFTAFTPSHPPHVERPTAGASARLPLAAVGGEHPAAALAAAEAAYDLVAREAIYASAALEEKARVAATRAAASSRVAPSGSATSGTVGDCTGFAIPDEIIQRESGGNPFAQNASSGAFGCAQVMPFHWAPGGACAGLDRWNVDDQRTCVDWLSQGGTRLSPWAATR